MANQITILNSNIRSDGSFTVSGVFWLVTPTNSIVPNPNFKSQVSFIDANTLLSLQYGTLTELPFTSGLFNAGTTLSEVQSYLQQEFNTAQQNINDTSAAISGLVGTVFDGTSWNSSNVFGNLSKTVLSDHHTKRFAYWSTFKTQFTSKNGQIQYDDDGYQYNIWFYDGPEIHLTYIWKNTVPAGIISAGYSQAQNDADKTDFENNFKSISNNAVVPRAADGRANVAPNSFPIWSSLCFAGRGDDDGYGIGQGPNFYIASDTAGDTAVTFHFTDVVYIMGAVVNYTGAKIGDTLDYYVYAPATITGSGTQDVATVNVGPGNILIPSPTTANTKIDLTTAIPIPNQTNTGYWDWSSPKQGKGTVTPNYAGLGSFDLYDFSIKIAHVGIEMPIVGDNRSFEILVESVTSMQVLPHWTHVATVHNSGHTGLAVTWILTGARYTSV
jgi:hypothetical protein